MTRRSTILIFAAALFLPAALFAQTNEALFGQSGVNFIESTVHTLPIVALNIVPGFGLGSYLQGDAASGYWLTGADLLAAALLTPPLVFLAQHPDAEPNDLQLISLLAGYAAFAVSKVAATIVPIVHVASLGFDPHELVSPLVYNLVPGFGLGSLVQGDEFGANVLALLDGGAYVGIGVLAFAALSGNELVTQISGITAYSLFGLSKVFGIVRPFVYEHQRVSATRSP